MLNREQLRPELHQQPENPSERYPLITFIFKCDFCGEKFLSWKAFLDHMEKKRHRICYKCGKSCGGMAEFLRNEFVAIRFVEDSVEWWKYKHVECPVSNPSERQK
jgi:hypothetical protein